MFFLFPQERFTQDTQPHYIYSPREMTRWVRGIFEALRPLETLPVEGLIRIWAHEAAHVRGAAHRGDGGVLHHVPGARPPCRFPGLRALGRVGAPCGAPAQR